MRAVLADTGLRVVEIEFLGGWALETDPDELETPSLGSRRLATPSGAATSAPASSAATPRWISTRPPPGSTRSPLACTAAACNSRSRRSRGRCWRDHTPWYELLQLARSRNLGQLIDVWHFYNNEGDPDSLTGPIAAVQLNDGPRVHEDFLAHAGLRACCPGRDLDVVGLIRAVLRTGFTGPWCIEVNTPEFRALPVDEAAHRAATAACAALAAAGAPRTRA